MSRVLIVDDSLTVRKVVERILASCDLEVLQASLGTEAIERIQRDEPDVVLCDVLLPDREGYEVCEFVKSHPRLDGTPVLLISGIVNPAVIDRAARVGSAGVMRKPFSADELTAKVHELLGRSAAAPSPAWGGNGGAAPAEGPVPAAPPIAAASPNGTAHLPPAATPATPGPAAPAAPPSLEECLSRLAAADGVHSVILADREGRLIATSGGADGVATLAALTACLASAGDELCGELGRGELHGLILEQGRGLVLVSVLGDAAVLTLVLDEPAALGKARYYVKRAAPELLGAL
jgi:CheY-like chemotaxis protein/predicted regulator of Ras-like GTPase activity (Roadblock/LC7/MglB family)